jgi:DNA modification methylase
MTITILTGCCLSMLATLPDKSVHTCVCSPPYWGLRDYGTGTWEGGDAACAHDPGGMKQVPQTKHPAASASITSGGNRGAGRTCLKCGATRADQQLGLEATPEEYVANMVAVFREVRRVLRDDGTLWLNLGDSYTSGGRGYRDPGQSKINGGGRVTGLTAKGTRAETPPGLKPKDLVGIPWMTAFALRADGWYLRSDIIWEKPNPMPESVTDRPTKSHEYLFLLSKSERYYYDHEAIAEPVTASTIERLSQPTLDQQNGSDRVPGKMNGTMKAVGALDTRNRRTVWTIPTKPFSEAHFATYPAELIEPCILAGSPVGGTVLDPFFGAGTTALVADRLGRHAIGIELNPDYVKIAEKRLRKDAGMFADIVGAV